MLNLGYIPPLALCILALGCSEGDTYTRHQPIEGMGGYEIIVREAQPPEPIVRGIKSPATQEGEIQPGVSLATTDTAPEPSQVTKESLRRERLPLRLNRNLLLLEKSQIK